MKNLVLFLSLMIGNLILAQKNFIDQPYIETQAKVDTLITPDKIYLSIVILENDTKGKMTIEELETQMINKLKSLNINIEKDLSISDLSSNFRKYFLKEKVIMQNKAYSLIVKNAALAGKVVEELEAINISNISIEKTEYSQEDALLLDLNAKAVQKAQKKATAMLSPLKKNIGNVLYVSDSQVNYSGVPGATAGIRIRGISSSQDSYKVKETQPNIEIEKIRFASSVNVKFAIQ